MSGAMYGTPVLTPAMAPATAAGTDAAGAGERCAVCGQAHPDVRIVGCGCLLHTTYCPCCHRSPIVQIRVLPLPMVVLEEAGRLREKDNEILNVHGSDASPHAPGSPVRSIALYNGSHKRAYAATKPSVAPRSYRTGRWSSEESAYTDKLIRSFDAGLLPLPHGIKLNDFLCDLLSCRTSRLTKKLKNAKLSARTYRSWTSSGAHSVGGAAMGPAFASDGVGGDVQRAQTLFLKTITPEWVRMELQFNISRMWRTHLANFCLQISYLNLDTKEWFASLDAVDHIAMSCNDDRLQARRKRMRSALTEDANAAARTVQPLVNDARRNGNEAATNVDGDKEGVFVGGLPFQRLSSLNLKAMADEAEETTVEGESENSQHARTRKLSFETSVLEQSMKHSTSMSSFVELFSDVRPSLPPSRGASRDDVGALSIDAAEDQKNEEFEVTAPAARKRANSQVDDIIDEAIDSVLASSGAGKEQQGVFLREIARFLAESQSPFQHVDLWVPMDVSHAEIVGKQHIGGSSAIATTSSKKVNGIIYGGGQQESSVRLSNAGYVTVRAPPHIMSRLNEFGMYSKNFSFSPGFGMPGRVFVSRIPSWENNLSQMKTDQFARVGGAKIYGVNTSLCLPIFTPVGTMVVALYSTQNLGRDMAWERKCMEYFWKLKPEPKWKLTIDVGLKTTPDDSNDAPPSQAPNTSPSNAPENSQAFVIPPSPKASKPSEQLKLHQTLNPASIEPLKVSAAPAANTQCWTEQSLALLLGKYMPLDRQSPGARRSENVIGNQDVADSLMSLRLLLLRHSSCRTKVESRMVGIVMGKYHSYLRSNKQEHDLILSVVNDWKRLTSLSSTVNGAPPKSSFQNQGPKAMRVNYGGQTPSFLPNVGFLGSSPAPSPSLNPSVSNVSMQASPHRVAMSSTNQPGNNFGIPLASYAQNMVNATGPPSRQYLEQNNVPRVVSEQGPIEQDTSQQWQRQRQ